MHSIDRQDSIQYVLAIIFTRQLWVTAQSLFFFKGLFHVVYTDLNSVSLGHIVLTMASQSQHGLAPVSLSELIFPLAHSDVVALAVCQFWEHAWDVQRTVTRPVWLAAE